MHFQVTIAAQRKQILAETDWRKETENAISKKDKIVLILLDPMLISTSYSEVWWRLFFLFISQRKNKRKNIFCGTKHNQK